jgi:hypothetical protein
VKKFRIEPTADWYTDLPTFTVYQTSPWWNRKTVAVLKSVGEAQEMVKHLCSEVKETSCSQSQ